MATSFVPAQELASMVQHWLGCGVNGYLGSGYGSDVKALLQTPMASGLADGLIAKCKQDVPLLQLAAPGAVNVYAFAKDIDKVALQFDIGGQSIPIGEAS